MSTMDLKGIAWVGNIYQKFEAMCLEVEETMYQDTAKYVENQVQTVGASVKRFYSDVMQDLLPPSCLDPEKVIHTDLFLNENADVSKKDILAVDNILTEDCKKNSPFGSELKTYSEKNKARETYRRSNAGIKRISKRDNYSKNTLPKDTSKGISDNRQVVCDEISVLSSHASVENIACGPSEEGKKCDNNNITEVIESPVFEVDLLEDSCGKKETRLRDDYSNDGLPGESIETCTNRVLVSQRGSDTTGDDTHNDHSADEEVFISLADLIEDNDATEPTGGSVKQEDKSKLEETCVFVDGDKLGFVSQTEGKNRSYKKKFRKAFSLKMKSGRKQEYEQLAAQYEDAATPTLTSDLHTVKPNSCESEWELL